jgi:hypothetical protein
MPGRKRSLGKFAMKVARSNKRARKGQSLASKVATLAVTVKKDHKILAKAFDYNDYQFPTFILTPGYKLWGWTSLMAPAVWTSTCQLDALTSSNDTMLMNMTVSIMARHGTNNQNILYTCAIIRGKKDWHPQVVASGVSGLRNDIDVTEMGTGMAPLLNRARIQVLKKWTFVTTPDLTQNVQRRTSTVKLNQRVKANPALVTGLPEPNSWKTKVSTDFALHERLYFIYYATAAIADWTASYAPAMTVGVKFTTKTLG